MWENSILTLTHQQETSRELLYEKDNGKTALTIAKCPDSKTTAITHMLKSRKKTAAKLSQQLLDENSKPGVGNGIFLTQAISI